MFIEGPRGRKPQAAVWEAAGGTGPRMRVDVAKPAQPANGVSRARVRIEKKETLRQAL